MEPGKATLSMKEFAEIMGVSRSLIYKLAASGDIPIVRIGKRRLVIPVWVAKKMLKERG